MLLAGCTGEETGSVESETSLETGEGSFVGPIPQPGAEASPPPRKVEVIHFHGTHQCYSCVTVGQYAEETINTYFSKEVSEGKLSFAHINAELPENREKAAQYGATGSSLWIGVYADNGFQKEENVMVWYKISDKEEYMKYLKEVLEEKLRGA